MIIIIIIIIINIFVIIIIIIIIIINIIITEHRQNSGIPRNSSETTEHPVTPAEDSGIPSETNVTPAEHPVWNNGTIQNEEQL